MPTEKFGCRYVPNCFSVFVFWFSDDTSVLTKFNSTIGTRIVKFSRSCSFIPQSSLLSCSAALTSTQARHPKTIEVVLYLPCLEATTPHTSSRRRRERLSARRTLRTCGTMPSYVFLDNGGALQPPADFKADGASSRNVTMLPCAASTDKNAAFHILSRNCHRHEKQLCGSETRSNNYTGHENENR